MRSGRPASWLRPVIFHGQNPITLTGIVLTTTSAATMVLYRLYVLMIGGGGEKNPYAGIVIFLILPAFFVLGLILMPVGELLRWHRLRRRGELPTVYSHFDLADPVFRKTAVLVAVATLLNNVQAIYTHNVFPEVDVTWGT
jgi:hypothetical protein